MINNVIQGVFYVFDGILALLSQIVTGAGDAVSELSSGIFG